MICVTCHAEIDQNSHPTDTKIRPKPGDITLCIHCGQAYQFDAKLREFPLRDSEIPEDARGEIMKLRYAIARASADRIAKLC
jgi:hypothetical protein